MHRTISGGGEGRGVVILALVLLQIEVVEVTLRFPLLAKSYTVDPNVAASFDKHFPGSLARVGRAKSISLRFLTIIPLLVCRACFVKLAN